VKSSFRSFIGAITLCLTVLLSGCGQTGPLYLPKPPAAKSAKSGDAKVTPPAGVGSPAPAPAMAPAPATPIGQATPVTGAPVTPSELPSTVPASQQ
jgi:predicted small lipoprotein YifL